MLFRRFATFRRRGIGSLLSTLWLGEGGDLHPWGAYSGRGLVKGEGGLTKA
jgi:hypothetical protein